MVIGSATTLMAALTLTLLQPTGAPEVCAEEDRRFRCLAVAVPEDHGAPEGRSIDLKVLVLPALAPRALPDPLVFVTGGPGQAATDLASALLHRTGGLARRDVVLVDQRGTGASNSLACRVPPEPDAHFGRVLPSDSVLVACLRNVQERADPAQYTTASAVRDLEHVRRHLGYEQVNLRGVSYGTRVVVEYLRRYPAAVRSAHLVGVAPPGLRAPLPYARFARDALQRLFQDCRANAACSAAHPDPAASWDRLLERLAHGPVPVTLDGAVVGVAKGDIAYAVRSILYGPGALALPDRIDRAAATGDISLFARAHLDRSRRVWEGISAGAHLAVFCSEDVPFIDDDGARENTSNTWLGSYLVDEYRRACRVWPSGPIPADFHEAVASDLPVLIESGRRDPSTPPEAAEPLLAHLSRAVHVVHPWGGHGFLGTSDTTCRDGIVEAFLESASVDGLDLSCVEHEPPLPFESESGEPARHPVVDPA